LGGLPLNGADLGCVGGVAFRAGVQITENATAIDGARMGLLIVAAAWTRTRWGQIAGLQRTNTHLDDGVIVIDRYAGGLHESGSKMRLGPTKTAASVRVISLPPFLIALLRQHLDRTDAITVFPGPQGGWLRRSNFDRRILLSGADGPLHLPAHRCGSPRSGQGRRFTGCGTVTC
jgi:integrase